MWMKIKIWLGLAKKLEPIKPKRKAQNILELSEEKRLLYYVDKAERTQLTTEHIEQRFYEQKLKSKVKQPIAFEFVPEHQSNRNIRSYLEYKTGSYHPWQAIRNDVEKKSNGVCCICGESSLDYGKDYATECHEVWYYDYASRTQELKRFEALCVSCHSIKHLNQHKRDKELFDMLLDRYAHLNSISKEQAYKDYIEADNIREKRKNIKYTKIEMKKLKPFYDEAEDYFECHTKEFNQFIANWKNKE